MLLIKMDLNFSWWELGEVSTAVTRYESHQNEFIYIYIHRRIQRTKSILTDSWARSFGSINPLEIRWSNTAFYIYFRNFSST